MTLQRAGGGDGFSASAQAYEATMAPALRPVAREVVRRAALRPDETVLDIGTGTGTAAALAVGDRRRVIGLDAAPGMLEVARRDVAGVEFVEADFTRLPMTDASVDVVIAAHALLFADDRVAALHEWLRATAPDGRLSLSVPGPDAVVPSTVLGPVYDRHGITRDNGYPTERDLAGWAATAGWTSIETAADATVGIDLDDDEQFRTWLSVGARGRATPDRGDERRDRLARDLMAATPRAAGGRYRLPFGALYLTARRPS